MTLAQYAKKEYPDIDINGYRRLEREIKGYANSIMMLADIKHKPDTGLYWPVKELHVDNVPHWPYVVQELKQMGMEFIDNNEYYRI